MDLECAGNKLKWGGETEGWLTVSEGKWRQRDLGCGGGAWRGSGRLEKRLRR
jgi:hypothetical protein